MFVSVESRRSPLRRKLELDEVQIARVVRAMLAGCIWAKQPENQCRGDVEGRKVERGYLQVADETQGGRAHRAQYAVAVQCDRPHHTDERLNFVTGSLLFSTWCDSLRGILVFAVSLDRSLTFSV